jgi:O-antigen/teichoic acid export membrane protein
MTELPAPDVPGPDVPGPAVGSLLLKTAQGTGWVIGWRMATRILGVISTLTLVRLLLPSDFGLVALSASFAQSIEAFSVLGVEDAVVREKAPTRDIYDTGFTLNMLRSITTAAVILALAIPAGSFFAEPRLTNILAALAVGTFLDGFTNIGIVDFRRDFAFSKEFQLWILPRLVAIIATLAVAFVWRSYWALVVGSLVSRGLRVIFSYHMHPFRPRVTVRAWRRLIGYSTWSWAVSVIGLMRDRSDTILIGRMLNPTQVGIYSIGAEVAALPTTELVEPLCRAAFSGFAAGRNADVTPGDTYLRIIATMALLTLPAGVGIALVADPLVNLAFGTLWAGAVPLVQVLSLAGTLTVFGLISGTLFSAHGLLRQMFELSVATLILRVALLIFLIDRMGLYGAALAAAIAITIEQSLYVLLTIRHFRLRPADLLRHTWRCLLATAAMAAVLLRTGLGHHTVTPAAGALAQQLAVAVVTGVAVYSVVLLAAWLAAGRPPGAETDFLALARRLIGRIAGARRSR